MPPCPAQLVLVRREPERFSARQRRRAPFTAALALLVVILMIAGSGATIMALTAGCVLLPLPFYLLRRRQVEAVLKDRV